MTYQFTNKRSPKSVDELSEAQRQQLHTAWAFYAREDKSAAQLLSENSGWFELWTVERDGTPVFEYWHMPPDSGTLFYIGEPAPTGIEVVQCAWHFAVRDMPVRPGMDLKELAKELSKAWGAISGHSVDNDNDDDNDDDDDDDDDDEYDFDAPPVLVRSAKKTAPKAAAKTPAPKKKAAAKTSAPKKKAAAKTPAPKKKAAAKTLVRR